MKLRYSPFLVTLVLIVSAPLMSHAKACSNSTIRGSYAYTIHGQVFLPNGLALLIDGLARTAFDGEGNLTELDAVAANGNFLSGTHHGGSP